MNVAWNDASIQGALIGVLGTLAGVLTAFLFAVVREWRLERRNRDQIAIVLHQELFDHAQATALCGSYTNAFATLDTDPKKLRVSRSFLDHEAPDHPIVFEALAGRLHELGAAAGALVGCYGAIREAKRSTAALPDNNEFDVPNLHADILDLRVIRAWRRACKLAADALDELGKIAVSSDKPDLRTACANLIRNLRNLSEGEVLLGHPVDTPSHMEEAPESLPPDWLPSAQPTQQD